MKRKLENSILNDAKFFIIAKLWRNNFKEVQKIIYSLQAHQDTASQVLDKGAGVYNLDQYPV